MLNDSQKVRTKGARDWEAGGRGVESRPRGAASGSGREGAGGGGLSVWGIFE